MTTTASPVSPSSAPGLLTGRWRLMVASSLMLFVQLALIRWTGSNLLHMSYFSNLILLASFLGIGLGFLRSKSPRDLGRYTPLGLLFLVAFITFFPASVEVGSKDLIMFHQEVGVSGLPSWVTLPLVFLVTAVTMTGFGEITGRAFREFAALDAYRWDIIGSILGTLAFTLVSFLRAPSWVWPVVTFVALILLFGKKLPIASAIAMALVIVALVAEALAPGVSWSPYYKITTTTKEYGSMVEAGKTAAWTDIWVNGIPHQAVTDVNEKVALEPVYLKPYEHAVNNPLNNVLIVGAGSGNDLALALKMGAKHVDAVEIDPRIQQIGQQINPNQPYSDPRVSAHINDGRAFLSGNNDKYDLILFALPDSLTLVAGASQLRLESYLFTQEAIQSAYDHLSDDGVFAMYNFYREPWLVNRLSGTVESVFGHDPCLDRVDGHALAAITIGKNADNAACTPGAVWDRADVVAAGQEIPSPSTDDRPFLYLKDRTIPGLYLVIILLILGISLVGIRLLGGPFRQMAGYVDLFFMGAAFLLLETRSITTFALLFGTTWVVNALVFTGVLLAVLLAIEVTQRVKKPIPRPLITTGVFASLLVAFLIPNEMLLGLPVPLRLLTAVVIAFAPIFFANLLFTSRFKLAQNPTAAFAANLFGAMVGGTLEYLSLVTGYRWLLAVAALLYLAAILVGQRYIKQGTEVKAPVSVD